jgi:hypothetical protein
MFLVTDYYFLHYYLYFDTLFYYIFLYHITNIFIFICIPSQFIIIFAD